MNRNRDSSTFDVEGFGEFRKRAVDASLSTYEKVGFPDEYRAGKTPAIMADIRSKLTNLDRSHGSVLEIGPGCSDLPVALIEHCGSKGNQVVLVDSAEMLDQLPDAAHIVKIPGAFPACEPQITQVRGLFDVILVYSVIQYVFTEANLWGFIDRLAALLADGGQMLIGDIPNASRRKRFLSSARGHAYHREHFGSKPFPTVEFNRLEPGVVDDSVVMAIAARMRAAGFDAFIVPQAEDLPMANRREDILICKP